MFIIKAYAESASGRGTTTGTTTSTVSSQPSVTRGRTGGATNITRGWSKETPNRLSDGSTAVWDGSRFLIVPAS